MAEASVLWSNEVRRWHSESLDPESGEPAMPHDTFFDREMPLYVDWDYYSKKWLLPNNKMNAWKFESDLLPSCLERLRAELAEVKLAEQANLLSPEALMAVNLIWSGSFVNDKTTMNVVEKLERRLVDLLMADKVAAEEDLHRSPLFNWPLYHFTTASGDLRSSHASASCQPVEAN